MDETIDPGSVHSELERARATFRSLVEPATQEALQRQSDGTKWTNQQLLFHMLFGYLVVLRLLPLVRALGRVPARYSRVFSAILNAAAAPYDRINYLGSCGGALVFKGPRLVRMFDRTITALHTKLDRETGQTLGRRMHFPVRWDPFFTDTMTLLEVYHFGTQHFDFHRHQLTLG